MVFLGHTTRMGIATRTRKTIDSVPGSSKSQGDEDSQKSNCATK